MGYTRYGLGGAHLYLNGDGTMASGPDYTCSVVRLWLPSESESNIRRLLQQLSRAGKEPRPAPNVLNHLRGEETHLRESESPSLRLPTLEESKSWVISENSSNGTPMQMLLALI